MNSNASEKNQISSVTIVTDVLFENLQGLYKLSKTSSKELGRRFMESCKNNASIKLVKKSPRHFSILTQKGKLNRKLNK